MTIKPSGVVGGMLTIAPHSQRKPSGPTAVDTVVAHRKFAALRGKKADERARKASSDAKQKRLKKGEVPRDS